VVVASHFPKTSHDQPLPNKPFVQDISSDRIPIPQDALYSRHSARGGFGSRFVKEDILTSAVLVAHLSAVKGREVGGVA
jgi:hypothetical protein